MSAKGDTWDTMGGTESLTIAASMLRAGLTPYLRKGSVPMFSLEYCKPWLRIN
jgi:hypothetical protein